MTRVVHLTWLVALWIALWGELTVANVLAGVVVALVVVAIAGTRRSGQVVVRPLRVLQFAGYFAFKLVEASLIVAREVLARRRRIRTGIVAVPLHGCSDAVATLIADAISLTPGTLTVEVASDPLTLFVHVLHLRDVEQVRQNVRRLEVLAVRAFGTPEAIAGLLYDDTRTVADTRSPSRSPSSPSPAPASSPAWLSGRRWPIVSSPSTGLSPPSSPPSSSTPPAPDATSSSTSPSSSRSSASSAPPRPPDSSSSVVAEVVDVVSGILAIAGGGFVLLAGIGVLRFPDLYSRMHAATEAPSLGFLLTALAALLVVDDGRGKLVLVLAIAVVFVTSPIAAHLVGRSAYRAPGIDTRFDADDDLGRALDDQSDA